MSPSPFSIQPIDELGCISHQQDDAAFEDAVGERERGGGYAAFLGASITKLRIRLGGIVVVLVLSLFAGRAAFLQVVHGAEYFALAEGNRVRQERLPADRGLILDREGRVIAANESSFSLIADLDALEGDEDYARLIEQAAHLLEVAPGEVHGLFAADKETGAELLLSDDVTHASAMQLLASPEHYPHLRIESGTRRVYNVADAYTLSSLVGYTGIISKEEYQERRAYGYLQTDLLGKIGLERSYEDALRGFPGERAVEVNATGVAQSILSEREAVDGANLTLNIDRELQAYIESRLNALKETNPYQNASVIALDPRDGGVRALVSYPGYDANAFVGRIDSDVYQGLVEDPARPLFTRAYSGQYPSGSTFKLVVAALGLDAGIIDERTSYLSTGGIRIGQFFFPDWKAGGHGLVAVKEAIAQSVNTFFYIIGGGYRDAPGLGLEAMMSGAARFGLGAKLGVDVPGEANGFLPSVAWKNETKNEPWYIGDTYHVAIGQGDILVTPLQVAAYTSVFANGGVLFQPQIVDSWDSQGRMHDLAPVVLNKAPASAESIAIVREGMREAVTYGSARRLSTLPVTAAGKTGTAQWHSEKANHAWFTGFAPYDDPELVVTVLVEEGGEGSSVAVPVAYDILNWWFTK